jgi:glucans biosynthesis protein C
MNSCQPGVHPWQGFISEGENNMDTKATIRNNYLDWLRVLGILLVFIYHTTRLYNVEDWVVKNNIWYPSVEVWNGFSTSFMMPLMFFISGASLFYAMGKGGFGKFLKDKTLRLLVPLLVCDLTHAALQAYLYAINHAQFSGNFFQFLPQYYHLDTIAWEGMHLWYLLYLFVFSIILYPLMRWLKGIGRSVLSRLGSILTMTGVLYTIVFPFLLMYLLLNPDGPLMKIYGGYPISMYLWFVLLGFILVSDEHLLDRIRQLRWVSLSVGLVLVAGFCIILNLLADKNTISPGLILAGAMRIFGGWICVLAIFGLAMQYLTVRTSRLEYANEAVLPFYILHQTVLLVVAYFVLQWSFPDVLEWATVVVISFALIMVIYEYLVRRWNVMRYLFGMKPLKARSVVGAVEPQAGSIAPVG